MTTSLILRFGVPHTKKDPPMSEVAQKNICTVCSLPTLLHGEMCAACLGMASEYEARCQQRAREAYELRLMQYRAQDGELHPGHLREEWSVFSTRDLIGTFFLLAFFCATILFLLVFVAPRIWGWATAYVRSASTDGLAPIFFTVVAVAIALTAWKQRVPLGLTYAWSCVRKHLQNAVHSKAGQSW